MLGQLTDDWDTNWSPGGVTNNKVQAEGRMVLKIDEAVEVESGIYDVPMYYHSLDGMFGFDVDMNFDAGKLEVLNAEVNQANGLTEGGEDNSFDGLTMVYNNTIPGRFLLTAFTLNPLSTDEPIFTIRIKSNAGPLTETDFPEEEMTAMLNGQLIQAEPDNIDPWPPTAYNLQLYPNPTRDHAKVLFPQAIGDQAIVEIWSMDGSLMRTQTTAGQAEIDLDCRDLAAGMYIVNLQTASGIAARTKLLKLD